MFPTQQEKTMLFFFPIGKSVLLKFFFGGGCKELLTLDFAMQLVLKNHLITYHQYSFQAEVDRLWYYKVIDREDVA